jgi:hypothetical protein
MPAMRLALRVSGRLTVGALRQSTRRLEMLLLSGGWQCTIRIAATLFEVVGRRWLGWSS